MNVRKQRKPWKCFVYAKRVIERRSQRKKLVLTVACNIIAINSAFYIIIIIKLSFALSVKINK